MSKKTNLSSYFIFLFFISEFKKLVTWYSRIECKTEVLNNYLAMFINIYLISTVKKIKTFS